MRPDLILIGKESVPLMMFLWVHGDFVLGESTDWDSYPMGALMSKWRVFLDEKMEGGRVLVGVSGEVYVENSEFWREVNWRLG
jgi:hypothetical protein